MARRVGRVSVTTAAFRVLAVSVRGVLVVPVVLVAVGLAVVVLGVLDREVRGLVVSGLRADLARLVVLGLRAFLVRLMVLGLRLVSLRAVAVQAVLARRRSEVGVMRRRHNPEPRANRRSAVVAVAALVGLARAVVPGVADRVGRRAADLRASVRATWW